MFFGCLLEEKKTKLKDALNLREKGTELTELSELQEKLHQILQNPG